MPTTVVPHKKRGPAPTGKGRQVQVRLQPDLLAAVDAYAIDLGATADDQPMRPEAIRNLIVQALALRKLGRRFILRDAARMREMWAWEETIRNSETWKGKPEGAEAAVKRYWLTGGPDTGGSDWSGSEDEIRARQAEELERFIRFNFLWRVDPELARQVDWSRS